MIQPPLDLPPVPGDPLQTREVPAEGADKVGQRLRSPQRRARILQVLAEMLESPSGGRITTAALAARLELSEAALYRHFRGKAEMFEALIDFIEQSVFSLVQQAGQQPGDGLQRVSWAVTLLLQFGEANPGMVRVMVGDALVQEHEGLRLRMNQVLDRVEAQLRTLLREAERTPVSGAVALPVRPAVAQASVLMAFVLGRWQRYARSGFQRVPTEHLEPSIRCLLG